MHFWPEVGRSINDIKYPEFVLKIEWTKNLFEDYKFLSENYAECGYSLLLEIVKDLDDNEKCDHWFLSAIYLMRQSIELGLKALYCRAETSKPKIQKVFLECKHDLSLLYKIYLSKGENYLTTEEQDWLCRYLESLESVDENSDMFRFPFDDEFLAKYQNKFLDIYATGDNILQAFNLVKKCFNCGVVGVDAEFDNSFAPHFLIFASHGIGNCYLWKSVMDEGFYAKVNGYMESADFIFYRCNGLALDIKVYPLLFLVRNALELCLKRLFYEQVHHGVSLQAFNSKRKSHLIKKDLWKNVKPMLLHYAEETASDVSLLNIVENSIEEISGLDKNGDNFRYPTKYSLDYILHGREIDVKNVFEIMRSVVSFLDSCDTMLEAISDYESARDSYYEY